MRILAEQMTALLAGCQTKVTLVTAAATAPVKVLAADPRRLMVRFYNGGGAATVQIVVPGVPLPSGLTVTNVSAPIESKFADAPGWCSGEWYSIGGPGVSWLVVEQLWVVE